MEVSKEKLLAEVNELRERIADQERQLTLAQQALADKERGMAKMKLKTALEELGTCMRELSSQLLDGTLSREDHNRFLMALAKLQIEFPKSLEII